jgi:hypothetical protein
MDLFLAYAYHDEDYASGLEEILAGRGLVVGEPLSLWPGQRHLPPIDLRLRESRAAIVIVSRAFLKYAWPRKELDGLTIRRKVIAILSDVGEMGVADHSPRFAVAAFPGSHADRLVHLIRPEDDLPA